MRNTLIFSMLILFYSCNSDDTNSDTAAGDTTFITEKSTAPSIEAPAQFKNLVWSAIFDSAKGDMVLKQQRQVNADTLTADKLIKEINASWDGIKMELKKISHDTIYVAIPESNVLTQQMGSSGANGYMSSTTFTLTELKNIKFVNYNFAEGDHVAPGTFKRSDFKN